MMGSSLLGELAGKGEVQAERFEFGDGVRSLGLGLCFELSDEFVERRHGHSMGYTP